MSEYEGYAVYKDGKLQCFFEGFDNNSKNTAEQIAKYAEGIKISKIKIEVTGVF